MNTVVRSMPASISGSYRDPLNLLHLYSSPCMSGMDQLNILREFFASLVRRFSDVEVFVGRQGKVKKLSSLVSRWISSSRLLHAMEYLVDLEEFGGRDETLPMLAEVMQPYWLETWRIALSSAYDGFGVPPNLNPAPWMSVFGTVLGTRQLLWIVAQCARVAVSHFDWEQLARQQREALTDGIEYAESVAAMLPTKQAASPVLFSLSLLLREPSLYLGEQAAVRCVSSAVDAAVEAQTHLRRRDLPEPEDKFFSDLSAAVADAIRSWNFQSANGFEEQTMEIQGVFMNLITPTLITSASRGLR